MIRKNGDRNILVYGLWIEGRTIDQISLQTGIPRSSVGYYVRKFNKLAQKGAPIAIQWRREKADEKAMANLAVAKNLSYKRLMDMLSEENGLDKVYKFLMIMKLTLELQRYIFPTHEEQEAVEKNIGYILRQMCDAMSAMK